MIKLENFIYQILESKSKSILVYVITLILFLLSVLTFPSEIIKAKMLPSKDSDTFSVYVDLKDGYSKKYTKEVTDCIARKLQENDIVTNISVFISEGQPLDFAALVKQSALKDKQWQAEMMINIKRESNRDISSFNLVSKLRPIIKETCNMYNANIKFIELPAGPPVLASIVAEIYGGENFNSQRDFAYKIAKIFKAQKTLVDIDVMASKDYAKYELILDNDKIKKSGISLEQIKQIVYLAYEGMPISIVNDNHAQNQIPIFLRLDDTRLINEKTEQSLKNRLKNLKLKNQYNQMISVSELVRVRKSVKEPELTSKNLKKMINVIAETNKDSQIYPLLEARTQMIKQLSSDYKVIKTDMLNLSFINKNTNEKFDLIFDGELKVTLDTFKDLGTAFIIALILIFFLMVIYYKSFAISGGIVLASFISIIGVILAHIIMDIFTQDTFYLTATSLIGFIGLIGINSRNSTLIIDFSKQLIIEQNMSINKAIAKATATRSKPIILTVLTMVFASSLLASDAVFGGLGVALIGGTLISYIVSMFFVPVIIKNHMKKLL
ncbi:efflux RND transporter permease subunit [Malaciobacter canalis]|uniref:efflux RND transporter permease subunit n=1 Tax=Malaciobacter canalis TaxID=1912871 RepID=UPI002244FB38|nr:efflux RND transporter permease subunit [Malaciobacter canalis]QEE33141.1 RND family efflux system, inner membrane transporter, AcrB family [Malaciobacter canalis]